MVKSKIIIQNQLGLHARASAKLLDLSSQFESEILIKYQNKQANAKSILCLMALGVTKNAEIEICIEGVDENSALAAITQLINGKFNEE